MMDREDESVLAHLRAENDYLSQSFAELKPLEDELFEEIKSRIEETDISVPVRKGAWWYFERTREGLNYPLSCRVPATEGDLSDEAKATYERLGIPESSERLRPASARRRRSIR